VYDLDGTLVKFVVDWDAVTDDVSTSTLTMIGPPGDAPGTYSTHAPTMEPVRKSRR